MGTRVVGVVDGDRYSDDLVIVDVFRVCVLSHMRVTAVGCRRRCWRLAASLVFRNCVASSGEP